MSKPHTLILGASEYPHRYAYMAANRLLDLNYPITLVGKRAGTLRGEPIHTYIPEMGDLHTVTMYLAWHNQEKYIDQVLRIKPHRIIFNPGAENADFEFRAKEAGILTMEACTLVMLSAGTY